MLQVCHTCLTNGVQLTLWVDFNSSFSGRTGTVTPQKGDYRPGDVIFFNFNGGSNAAHVGICESWDGSYITTIDGNTAPTNEANGGAVVLGVFVAYAAMFGFDKLRQTMEQLEQIRKK